MVVNKRTIAKDFAFNIVSNALPVIALQFFVQPFLASQLGAEKNGKFLTAMSLLHFVVMLLGTTLHTTRLLSESKYKESEQYGDFNVGLAFLCLPCWLATAIGCYILDFALIDILFISLLAVIWMIKDYAIVKYRLEINYKRILINNAICSVGYIIGMFLYRIWPCWYIIIITGTFLSFIYTIISSHILKEPFAITKLFKQTSKSYGILFLTEAMKVLILNFDRFVIYALMTGAAVSTYYSASIMGKLVSMVSVPIGNVVLSYLVGMNSMSKKSFHKISLLIVLVGLFSYIISVGISPLLLQLLYPDWVNESLSLIYLTCGISFFELCRQMLGPFILRFCNLKIQPKIYGVYSVLYVFGGYISLRKWGLMGFAVTNLIVTAIIALLVWYIGESNVRKLPAKKGSPAKPCV